MHDALNYRTNHNLLHNGARVQCSNNTVHIIIIITIILLSFMYRICVCFILHQKDVHPYALSLSHKQAT